MKLYWHIKTTPEELRTMLKTLGEGEAPRGLPRGNPPQADRVFARLGGASLAELGQAGEAWAEPCEAKNVLAKKGHPIQEGNGTGLRLSFKKVQHPAKPETQFLPAGSQRASWRRRAKDPGRCEVNLTGNMASIHYSTPAQAGRALGALLGGLVTTKKKYREATPFTMLGIMLDCSRNAVMTVEHLKLWLRRLALLGYNTVMLYTEDTYELPQEPYFGYQRGAYTKAELKEINDYAAKLNIEVIPCIQTLGHLEKILRHPAYAAIKDTPTVMLVGEPKTYKLIEKMISHWRGICRTKRIFIGMDETHDLGLGRYLDLYGYRRGFDLFNEHLLKAVQICKKYDFRPMIASDMYFRLGSKSQDYYDPAAVIPEDVIRKIPKEAELLYWDYYHKDKAFYLDWIARHRKMGKEPLMCSGIWTWNKYWCDYRLTQATAGACIEACREAEIKEIVFSQWGDNGAFCDHDSAFAGMVWCADKAYGISRPLPADLEKRFSTACGGSYRAHILAGNIHGNIKGFQPNWWDVIGGLQPDMWDDPFFETHFRTFARDSCRRMAELAKGFAKLASRLKPYCHDRRTGDLDHAFNIARAFADRYALSAALLAAYRRRDKKALKKIRAKIPEVVKSVQTMANSFRRMWLKHNKPQGLETIQGRFGMLAARYREISIRLEEYLAGHIKNIVELDSPCPPK